MKRMKLFITVLITEKYFRVICLPIMVSGIPSGLSFHFSPLCILMLNSKIMEGLSIHTKRAAGFLNGQVPGHRDCMIGSNSASLIADSYTKGIRGYDIETLYQAIIKNTKGVRSCFISRKARGRIL